MKPRTLIEYEPATTETGLKQTWQLMNNEQVSTPAWDQRFARSQHFNVLLALSLWICCSFGCQTEMGLTCNMFTWIFYISLRPYHTIDYRVNAGPKTKALCIFDHICRLLWINQLPIGGLLFTKYILHTSHFMINKSKPTTSMSLMLQCTNVITQVLYRVDIFAWYIACRSASNVIYVFKYLNGKRELEN